MAKGKDFYGKDIAEVIEQACRELGAGHEDLDIEVLETGSSGIFGLCKKKAHIRVKRKMTPPEPAPAADDDVASQLESIKASIEQQRHSFDLAFEEKRKKLTQGDELPAGVKA